MAHQIRRGLHDTDRLTVTFLDGEPAWCTDTKRLWIGDGVTPGGILVPGVVPYDTVATAQAQVDITDDQLGYVIETDTLYRYDAVSAEVVDGTRVLSTGDAGTTRWLAICGQYTTLDTVNFNDIVNKNQSLGVYNDTGGGLAQWSVVYASGYNATEDVPLVDVISSFNQDPMGILTAALADTTFGDVLMRGAYEITGFDTTLAAINDSVYSTDAGVLTLSPTPLEIGKVLTLNVNGTIYVNPQKPAVLKKYDTVADAEAVEGVDNNLCYVVETETFYRYEDAAGAYVDDNTYVLSTANGGNTRWLGISGRYVIEDIYNLASQTHIVDDTDVTKSLVFDSSRITTATERTISVPDINLDLTKNEIVEVYNNSGGQIDQYRVVEIDGDYAAGTIPQVQYLDSPRDLPLGVAIANIADTSIGYLIKRGRLVTALDCSLAAIGDKVYSDDTGNLTLTKTKIEVGQVESAVLAGVIYVNIGGSGGGSVLLPTDIKIANYTAVAGDLVRCDTSGGAFNVTLPASPLDGDVVGIMDAAVPGAFSTYNVTLLRNGELIDGVADDMLLDVDKMTIEFMYEATGGNWVLYENPQGASEATYPTAQMTLFMKSDASGDIAGYRQLTTVHATGANLNIPITVSATPTPIEEWATEVNSPGINYLLSGRYHLRVDAEQTGGTNTCQIYAEVYKRSNLAVETLLLTTDNSANLTGAMVTYDLYGTLIEQDIETTDRIVLKLFATPAGAGTDPTIEVEVAGTTFARIDVPVAVGPHAGGTGSGVGVTGTPTRVGAEDIDGAVNTIDTDIALYTVPGATYPASVKVSITNRNNAVVAVRLAHIDGALGAVANEDYILYDCLLQPYESKFLELDGLFSADTLLIRSDTTDVTFVANALLQDSDMGYQRIAATTVAASTDTALLVSTAEYEQCSIIACNKDSANSASVRIAVIDGALGALAVEDYIIYDDVILPNETKFLVEALHVANGQTIAVYSTDADVNFLLYGRERV